MSHTADRKPSHSRRLWSASFASIAGFAFDLYDLFILLFVAATIGPLMFPAESATLSLAAVYASFAVSLFMRPLGSFVFGPYADKVGRRKVLVITVTGVGVSTAAMGAVPTYEAAGLVGPVVFLLLRLVQGLFVGGIVASTHTLATETVPERLRGAMSGLVGGGGPAAGAVFASVAALVLHLIFPGDEFSGWGWRIMFFTGLLGAALSYFVLRSVEESPLWKEQSKAGGLTRAPVRTLFTGGRLGAVVITILMVSGMGASYYLTSGYLPTVYEQINELDGALASNFLIAISVMVAIGTVAAGMLSQRIGRRRAIILFAGVDIVVVPVLYWLITRLDAGSAGLILVLSLVMVFFSNAIYGPAMIYLNEVFPTRIRSTGTAFCWNAGFAIGGLMTTLVSLASPRLDDIPSRLVIFLVAWYAVTLVCVLLRPEPKGRLEQSTDESVADPTAPPAK